MTTQAIKFIKPYFSRFNFSKIAYQLFLFFLGIITLFLIVLIKSKTATETNPDNTVSIKLFIDKDKTGNWILGAEAKDDGKSYGGVAILSEGYAGIRTDFMDMEFDDYKIVKF